MYFVELMVGLMSGIRSTDHVTHGPAGSGISMHDQKLDGEAFSSW